MDSPELSTRDSCSLTGNGAVQYRAAHSATDTPVRILTRLIVADMLKVLTLALSGMTGITIVVFVAREALDEGVGPVALLRLIPVPAPAGDAVRRSGHRITVDRHRLWPDVGGE